MNVFLIVALAYLGLTMLNFALIGLSVLRNRERAKSLTRADWLGAILICLVPLLIPLVLLNENVLYKLKPYWHYFDKTDTPFKSDYQAKRKMHSARYRGKYAEFLKCKVQKIKYFGLFTIYKAES